jgi:hypothetical protein
MHRRIIVTLTVCALLVVSLATFFAVRIAIQEEQGTLCDSLRKAARYAAENAETDADLDSISDLIGVRVTRMNSNGEILYDTSG